MNMDSSKVYKIKYSLNMLPFIGVYMNKNVDPRTGVESMELANEDINLLAICTDSNELAMFESETLKDLIEFKWNAFAWNWHLFGCVIHLAYIVILFLYTDLIYIQGTGASTKEETGEDKEMNSYSIILLIGVIYPACYEAVQMFKNGIGEYLSDLGNYIDLIYIWGSIAMSILHMILTPYATISKILMSLIVILAIRRTFSFLKLFSTLSPIVTMLTNVFWDLRIFLTFYAILILLFSLMYGVLGIANYKLEGRFQDTFYTIPENETERVLNEEAPGIEYEKIGLFLGNIFQTVRISMGDFAVIAAADYLTQEENILFWIIWLITVIVTCIVFLNFIVAEASASYAEVSDQLENYIQLQRADLVAEAESL
jgi:hypothetical protein